MFVTLISYSIITFVPLTFFASNSALATVALVYSFTVVPAEFWINILLTYLSNLNAKSFNSINPIFILEILLSLISIISVEATACFWFSINNSFVNTFEFSLSWAFSTLYFVNVYKVLLYSKITMYFPFFRLSNIYIPLSFVVASRIFPFISFTSLSVSVFNKWTLMLFSVFSPSSFFCIFAYENQTD